MNDDNIKKIIIEKIILKITIAIFFAPILYYVKKKNNFQHKIRYIEKKT